MAPPPYAAIQPPSEEGEKPVTVLVTSFGPFLSKYPKNSSWEIASTLPALIPATTTNPTPIHIHTYHAPIRVSYNDVLALVPTLLPPNNPMYPPPDIILHLGLAAGRSYYAIEQSANGRGYSEITDVDGQRFPDSAAETHFPASKYPVKLSTSFETSDVLARWKRNLGYTSVDGTRTDEGCPDVRISYDAGNFLCGFIYYNSLAHFFDIKEYERPVIFMHVPDLSRSEGKLREGWEVAVALIKALVESRRKAGGKVVDGPEGKDNVYGGGHAKRDVEKEEGIPAVKTTDNNFT
ncbi:pyroglutamyl peptidase type [Pyrenophora seminiperda CCB06]|uniref:Pyroglutamyl peptidase type n=1 Tax=Pyrenophora seminiperda CCB06 TaxID=1302712 RepID=A0A3M7M817_9PLEO|nr:pyroglutamyl peptidase type [Pyrenophora seminiperda CCB06]